MDRPPQSHKASVADEAFIEHVELCVALAQGGPSSAQHAMDDLLLAYTKAEESGAVSREALGVASTMANEILWLTGTTEIAPGPDLDTPPSEGENDADAQEQADVQ